ncbi:hypothetical protein TTHERM_01094840 (macronuclear) [Tetrahymena thermophila SB210]|uniref:Uncharacterized protein n=1 Tax=Tetrahymena thermophila (strain SB210) TaxID=312017 RepID=Q22ZH6_TETTS|nr:hypothetical protein TTHERM_01094840 [Tetrahymena thermophila SB210]EAR90671.2 hypothetical protein TTHERM_01094840 [Tetrahymena thermophila SB210]|eukprot:XP_001010916.2 hypothetical protein TTHERM_01094840 [Tetrahymena thermophila SB210]
MDVQKQMQSNNTLQIDQKQKTSIICGKTYTRVEATYRSFVSYIKNEAQVKKIIERLKKLEKFDNFYKYSYAYRYQVKDKTKDQIEEEVNSQQQAQIQKSVKECFVDEQGLQTVGEQLLNLLHKNSLENILIISAVDKRDILLDLNQQNLSFMVDKAEELLSQIFEASDASCKKNQSLIAKKSNNSPIRTKEFKLPLVENQALQTNQNSQRNQFSPSTDSIQQCFRDSFVKGRINYVFQNGKPAFLAKKIKGEKEPNLKSFKPSFLEKQFQSQLTNYALEMQEIISSFTQQSYMNMRFSILYDDTPAINRLLSVLKIIFDLKNEKELGHQQGDLEKKLFNLTVERLNQHKIMQIKELMIKDDVLSVKKLKDENKYLASVLQLVLILIKSYDALEKLKDMQVFHEKVDETNRKSSNDSQNGYNPSIQIYSEFLDRPFIPRNIQTNHIRNSFKEIKNLEKNIKKLNFTPNNYKVHSISGSCNSSPRDRYHPTAQSVNNYRILSKAPQTHRNVFSQQTEMVEQSLDSARLPKNVNTSLNTSQYLNSQVNEMNQYKHEEKNNINNKSDVMKDHLPKLQKQQQQDRNQFNMRRPISLHSEIKKQ